MSSEFSKVSLKQISSKIGDGIHGTPIYDENGSYYFINGNNLGSGRVVITSSTKKVSRDEYLKHKKDLNASTVLLSINGTIGNVALYDDEPVILGKSACYINVLPSVSALYIGYVLKDSHFQHYIRQQANGSTIKNVSLKLIRDYEFTLPAKFVQDRIAEILSSLDEKITVNKNIILILEKMAQALFKSWFVDFEPVKAKIAVLEAGGSQADATLAAMTAISGKDTDALVVFEREHPEQYTELKATAELFPSAMQESELGEIPEGWAVVKTEELVSKIGMGPFGSNIKVSTFVDEGIPVISGQHLKESILNDGENNFVTLEHADKLKSSNVFGEDIIFTHAGSIGQVSIIPEFSEYDRYVISQRQFFLRADKKLTSPYYLLYFFRSRIGQHLLLSNASQVGVPSIARPSSHLKNIELVVPEFKLVKKFEEHCKVIINGVVQRKKQTVLLKNIRDTLLPKLLSGEITLPEAEQAVSEVENV
ncbi:restriction endonuclease subunit S [Enterobacter ludwigii]|uniref:restriction endonuclease subunit S n=1 Tax=Enterobacter ludwigii TaxID=299767 RepID=UPI002A805EF2|nr:restriction endonuclease subunit S [Enterobacter ludwigii]